MKQFKTDLLAGWLAKATRYGIFAAAFFLPLSFDAASFFLNAAALAWFGRMGLERRWLVRTGPFDKWIWLLVGCSFISVAFSPDRAFSFYNYYHLMGRYVLFYYLTLSNFNRLEDVRRMAFVLLSASALVCLYGFYQYAAGSIMAAEWVDREQFPELTMRVFSTLENPNLLAGYLVSLASLTGGMLWQETEKRTKILLAALGLAQIGCLVLTYSRGSWLSLLAVVGLAGVLINRRLLWLLAVVPVALLIGHEAVLERIMSVLNPSDTSSMLRLALWESTVAMIQDHPWFGIGWGSYWLVYPEYDFFIQNPAVKILHAHNMYLNFAAEIGLPGFFAFMTILIAHGRMAVRNWRKAGPKARGMFLGMAASFVGILLNGLTDYVLFNIQLSLLYWLTLALIIVLQRATAAQAADEVDRKYQGISGRN